MPTLTPLSLILLSLCSAGLGISYFWPPLWWISLLLAGMMILAMVLDYIISPEKDDFVIGREINPKLSLSDDNPVRLTLKNRRIQAVKGILSENVPIEFQMRDIVFPFRIGAGEEQQFHYQIRPHRRGAYQFEHISLRIRGFMGLINKTWHLPLSQEVKVYPSYLQIKKHMLETRRSNFETAGRKKQKRPGEGREFESLREYNRGDEYRKINWKATARRGKPIVTQFRIERNQNVILVLDAGRMMRTLSGKMAKLDYAINTALMLSYLSLHKEDNVGLLVFGSQIQTYLPPKRGNQQLSRINEALYNAEIEFSEPDYAKAIHFLKRKVSKRSLILLLTDIIDQRASDILLREFTSLYPRHLPLCVTLKDRIVEQIALKVPENEEEMLELGVAQMLIDERVRALRHLQQNGILTLDSHPEDLTVKAINKYLEIKARSLI